MHNNHSMHMDSLSDHSRGNQIHPLAHSQSAPSREHIAAQNEFVNTSAGPEQLQPFHTSSPAENTIPSAPTTQGLISSSPAPGAPSVKMTKAKKTTGDKPAGKKALKRETSLTFTGFQGYNGLSYPSFASALADDHHGRTPVTIPNGGVDDFQNYQTDDALARRTISSFVQCFAPAYTTPRTSSSAAEGLDKYAENGQQKAINAVDDLMTAHGMAYVEHQCAVLSKISSEPAPRGASS